MAWRFRKSVGGKLFRVNLGKKGVTSFTIGGRWMPHVTTGRSGTRVGFSIPGTGVYYTTKVGKQKTDSTSSGRHSSSHKASTMSSYEPGTVFHPKNASPEAPTSSFPVQEQRTTVMPAVTEPRSYVPPDGGGIPPTGGRRGGEHGRSHRAWSRMAVAALVVSFVGIVLALTPAYTMGILLGVVSFVLGIIGLIITLRRKLRSPFAAVLAIVLAFVAIGVGGSKTPSTYTRSNDDASSSQVVSKDAASESSKKAEASKSAAAAAKKLSDAQSQLSDKETEAQNLIDSSNGKVADNQTRTDLAASIATAQALTSTKPSDYTDEALTLQSAMDEVTASEQKKTSDDAAAAAAKKAAEQKAAQEKAAAAAAASASAAAKASAEASASAAAKAKADASAAAKATQQSTGRAHGGSLCSVEGATAQSDRSSNILTCRVAADGRLRWKL